MSRIIVIEIPEASKADRRDIMRVIQTIEPKAEVRSTMSFESWVKLNKSEGEIIPAFLPKGADVRAIHHAINNPVSMETDAPPQIRKDGQRESSNHT